MMPHSANIPIPNSFSIENIFVPEFSFRRLPRIFPLSFSPCAIVCEGMNRTYRKYQPLYYPANKIVFMELNAGTLSENYSITILLQLFRALLHPFLPKLLHSLAPTHFLVSCIIILILNSILLSYSPVFKSAIPRKRAGHNRKAR